jgi:5-methylcytosine-specific restriction endonuclease McrA
MITTVKTELVAGAEICDERTMRWIAPRIAIISARKSCLGGVRRQLWNRDPRCYWCQRTTVLAKFKGAPLPPEAATVDHLHPKRHEARRRQTGTPVVLACHQCNDERNRAEMVRLTTRKRRRFHSRQGRAALVPGASTRVRFFRRPSSQCRKKV